MNSSVKSVDWWCLTFTKCKGNLFCSVSSVRMCEVQANEYQPCCLQLSASKANISLCHSQTWYPSMVPAGYSKKLKWTVMGLADLASVDFSSATPSPSSPSLPATLTVWSLLPSTNTSSFLQPWVRTELVSSAGLRCSLATYFGPRNLSTRQVCPLQTEALRGSPHAMPSLPLPSHCQRSRRKLFVSLNPGGAPTQPPLHTIPRRKKPLLGEPLAAEAAAVQAGSSGPTHRIWASSGSHGAWLLGPGRCCSLRPGRLHSPLSLAGPVSFQCFLRIF